MRQLGVMFLALICSAILLLCVTTKSKSRPTGEDWDPVLVEKYLVMPCDAMSDSYDFMYDRIQYTATEFEACVQLAQNNAYEYAGLMCIWIQQDFDFRYTHIKSLERAYDIMCGEDGQRKQPEIEIQF